MGQSTKERLSETLANINLQDDDGSDRMVIALDFGTTYSGYDHALSISLLGAD